MPSRTVVLPCCFPAFFQLIQNYWGAMVDAGADTFWEAYDPEDSRFSPYGDVHINNFCHAWSCSLAYLFRETDWHVAEG
jgi:alpha-L-rhamnosidase